MEGCNNTTTDCRIIRIPLLLRFLVCCLIIHCHLGHLHICLVSRSRPQHPLNFHHLGTKSVDCSSYPSQQTFIGAKVLPKAKVRPSNRICISYATLKCGT